jgi:hypothetical protein
MSSEIQTSRNRLIAGIAILAILLLIPIVALLLSLRPREPEPHIGRRSPVAELSYCGAEERVLCIVSFSQIVDGAMQVNLQTPRVFYPPIVLLIDRYGVESIYECHKPEPLSPQVVCDGPPQVPGEVLQFTVFFRDPGTVVAEGKFAIIGVALSTPEGLLTPTETATAAATPTPTARRTPTPVRTAPATSYPNPSYP